ncbi:MAG: TIGR04563 family protein [Bradymonadaceae bacterium]
MASDKRKQSLYFPDDHLEEIKAESLRQDRSMSWVVQKAWELSRDTIKQFPSANDFLPDEIVSDDERENEKG